MTILSHFKKGIAAVALSAMAFMVAPAVTFASLDFTDSRDIPTWATEAIEELVALGVFSGNDDGSFAPARQLNRAEVAKIIVLASGVDTDTAGGAHFPDVNEDAWFYDYIETMYNYGWIDGYPDGNFRPGNGINRAELAKMVVNALELDLDITGAPHFDDVSSNDWFFDYVETAYNYDLMRGYADGTFGPAKAVNRAETAKIVYDGLLAVAMPSGPAEGTLEVSLSNMTPRGTNVPYNATSVPYTTVELSASDDSDVEISSLTFTRLGLGDNDDFKNVWTEIDGFKVGNDKSINNDDVVELRFNPPIVVPAGQTLVADVVASAKYTSTDKNVGHHNRLALVSADDVASTAMNVVGDFPIEGEEMEVADYEVSQVEFTDLGSDTTVNVGDNFIEIGKFRMLNSSNTNKDVELRAVTFKNNGTAELENVLENVALYVSGEQVSAESIIDGDYITFRLDNGVTGGYIIEDGDSRIFSMRADIVSAEKSDTIEFKVDNFEDIVAIEIGTAFGVKAIDESGNDAEDLNATLKTYTIDSGDINVSRDPSSLGNQQYAPGSNDVVAMTARVIVDQPLLVDGVTLTSVFTGVDGTDTNTTQELLEANAHFNNFRLFLNDSLIDSENAMVELATATEGQARLVYDTTFEIAGASILKLVMNIQDAANTNSTIKFNIDSADFSSPEYISTGDAVPTEQLLGSAQGSMVEVTKSMLTITKTDGFSSETIVAGLDDVTFMEFVLDNNDSGDVNVTSVSIKGTGTGSADSYGNYTAAIFVDGTQQGSSKNLDTTAGTATFNDLSVVIPSAGQKEFALVVNTSEVLAGLITTTVNDTSIANADTTLVLTSVDGLTVGSVIKIAETSADTTLSRTLTAVNTTTKEVTFTTALATANLPKTGDTITCATHTMELDVTAVDSDNVENGQTVTVTDGSTTISATNPLDGSDFTLVQSGSLVMSVGSTVYSDILVAGTDDVEVLKIRFNAADDEVQIKDLYLQNDNYASTTNEFGPRADFKLYNEAGSLIQTKQMQTGDKLHFELANQDRISVPKDDSTFVTVKVDVRDITQSAMTGKKLTIGRNVGTTNVASGVEALTAATGTDVVQSSITGDYTGETFVAYRTQLSVKHAATQPNFSDPSTASQEMYRFTVSADAARQAELGRTTFNLALSGMQFQDQTAETPTAPLVFEVKLVKSDGTIDNTATVTSSVTHNVTASTVVGTPIVATSALVDVNFSNQKLSAGESRTYALFANQTFQKTGTTESDDDSVSTTIISDTTYNVPVNNAGGSAFNILWSDESSNAHSTTTVDWLNGYLLEVDTTSQVNAD